MNTVFEIRKQEIVLIFGGAEFRNCTCKDPEGLIKCRGICSHHPHNTFSDPHGILCKDNCYSAHCLPLKC